MCNPIFSGYPQNHLNLHKRINNRNQQKYVKSNHRDNDDKNNSFCSLRI